MEKKFIKFDDSEIEKYKFYQHEIPISMSKIYINKVVVSNKVYFCKKFLNISFVTKMLKKVDLYAYSFKKLVHKEKILIKLNVCLFLSKMNNF